MIMRLSRDELEALLDLLLSVSKTSAEGFAHEALEDIAETLTEWVDDYTVKQIDHKFKITESKETK